MEVRAFILFYAAFYFIFIACVHLEIAPDELSPVDCDSALRPICSNSGSYVVYLQTIIAHLASGECNELILNSVDSR